MSKTIGRSARVYVSLPTNPEITPKHFARSKRGVIAFAASFVLALGMHISGDAFAADEKAPANASGAVVIVARATKACFSDEVRVTGFLTPRREAVVGVDQEGFKVTDVLVHDGDQVADGQDLVRLIGPPGPTSRTGTLSLKSPAAGQAIAVNAQTGAMASPRAGPLVRIAVGNEIELDAEVPSMHVLKLKPGAPARININDGPELSGTVRAVDPEIDRRTQLGKARISVRSNPAIKVGMFARATIDANRSCGVSIPRSAVDHQTVQVVKDSVVETRRVEVGLVSNDSIEIRSGVKEGEVLVANAGTSLHDGDRIRTIFASDADQARNR